MNRPIAIFLALLGIASCTGSNDDCNVTNSCPNAAPNTTITSPADGSSVDEFETVSFQGSAIDSEDGPLSGGDLVWTSNLDGGLGTGTSFTRSDLSPGTHTITLTATDSDGRNGTASATLTVNDVANEAPDVTITTPADGASAASGSSVTFNGGATDPEEGALTGASLVWTSDLDGPLGTGNSFARSDLSGGTHEIVLTATDSQGAFGADTIAFTITGAPSVAITAPVPQSSGAPATVTAGASVTFTGAANDAEDGALTGASLVWRSNVDGQIGTGESFSTTALTPGQHTVTLTATDSDTNQSKATVLAIVKPASAAGFQIHIRWSEGVQLSPAQRDAVDSAVAKLQGIIVGDLTDLPKSVFPDVGTCGGAAIPQLDESVDDVVIYLEFVPIDGPNGTIGSAGPCFSRTGTAFTLVGGMRFDTADLATLDSFGLLDDIVVHEMMHVLGFGIFWTDDLTGLPDSPYLQEPSDPSTPGYDGVNTDTHFTGPMSLAWFDSIGGGAYTGGAIVPVENNTSEFGPGSLDGHWRESVFDNELMSPAANVGDNPLSVVTVAQFEDLGYTVDYDEADPYTQVFSIVAPGAAAAAAPVVDLSDDVWDGPLYEIDSGGAARRVR